jgi:hypothetical protein
MNLVGYMEREYVDGVTVLERTQVRLSLRDVFTQKTGSIEALRSPGLGE